MASKNRFFGPLPNPLICLSTQMSNPSQMVQTGPETGHLNERACLIASYTSHKLLDQSTPTKNTMERASFVSTLTYSGYMMQKKSSG